MPHPGDDNFCARGHGDRRHEKVDKAIVAGELSKARELTDEIMDKLNPSLSETAWMWTLRARLAGLAGDKTAQLIALRNATVSNGRWVSEKLYPNLLLVRTALELENGSFSEALSTHDKLLKAPNPHP